MNGRVLFGSALLLLAMNAGAQEAGSEMVVSTAWLGEHAASSMIVEVGDRPTFAAGHIPRAQLLDVSEILTDRQGTPNELPSVGALEQVFTRLGIGNRQRVILYSRDPILSARAWFTLDVLGHGRRAAILDGGFAKWTAEARPVATGSDAVKPAEFRAKPNRTATANLQVVRQLVDWSAVVAPRLTIIDARTAEQFQGEVAGPQVSRAGHIPGAVNVPWSENLTSGVAPRFLPENELRDLYLSVGVTKATTNVVYCRTGMQAAVTYFVLKSLGFDAALFDGSFVEWSNATGTEVVERRGSHQEAAAQ